MRYRPVLFFCALAIGMIRGNNRLDIYLSLHDCMNCYANLASLEAIPGYEKTIFICRDDSAATKELLENFSIQRTVVYSYIPAPARDYSFCRVFVKDLIVDTFPLTALPEKIKSLNGYAASKDAGRIKSYSIPPGCTLTNNRLRVNITGQQINVYDYILGKDLVFLLKPSSDTLTKILELKGQQFPQHSLLQLIKADTALYYNCYDLLKKIGKGGAHLQQAFQTDSSVFVLLDFPWIYIKPGSKADTALGLSLFLYEQNLVNGRKQFSHINDNGIREKFHGRYDINGSVPFFIDEPKGSVSLSLIDFERSDNSIYVLGGFTKNKKGEFDFERLENAKFDKEYFLKNKIDSFAVSANSRFYYSINLKMLIDHQKNSTILLPNYELPPGAFCVDITEDRDILKLLVLYKTEIGIVHYNLKDQSVQIGQKYVLPPDCSVNSLRFFDRRSAAFFNKASSRFSVMDIH